MNKWISFLTLILLLSACHFGNNENKADFTRSQATRDIKRAKAEPLNFKIIDGKILSDEDLARLALLSIQNKDKVSKNLRDIHIDLLYFRRLSLKKVAILLSDKMKVNIIASQKTENLRVNTFLKNVNARTAIETLCRSHGLWYQEEGNIVRIMNEEEYYKELQSKQSSTTRIFFFNYASAPSIATFIEELYGDRVTYEGDRDNTAYGHVSGNLAFGGTSNTQGATQTEQNNNTNDNNNQNDRNNNTNSNNRENNNRQNNNQRNTNGQNTAPQFEDAYEIHLTTLLSTNSLAVRCGDTNILREITNLLKELDVPTRQVLLEMKILDVDLTDGFESAFDFESIDNKSSDGSKRFETDIIDLPALANQTLNFAYLDGKIDARLQMLKTDNRVTSISSPVLMCANNAQARFFLGEERSIVRNYEFQIQNLPDVGTIESVIPTTSVQEIGTEIQIIPSINLDGTITLRFQANIGTVNIGGGSISQFSQNTQSVVSLPIDTINKNEVSTIIVAKNKQALVLGGLVRESEVDRLESVPVLGSIPVVNTLFSKKNKTKTKTETLIVMIPHIIEHPNFAANPSKSISKDLSDHPFNKDNLKKLFDIKDLEPESRIKAIDGKKKKDDEKNVKKTEDTVKENDKGDDDGE